MFTNLTQQFTAFWSSLKGRQRAVLILGSVTALLAMTVFINWGDNTHLRSGLQRVKRGRRGARLWNPSRASTFLINSREAARSLCPRIRSMMPASALPSRASLLVEAWGLNCSADPALGMTEFSQRVNYQQAMEGELERTISSISAIEMARVHIVTPEQSLLAYDDEPATASVTLQVNAGYPLDAGQIRAITHLVASSVEGLLPENVVVVDVNGNLLAAGSAGGAYSSSLSQTDSRRSAEESVASEIQGKRPQPTRYGARPESVRRPGERVSRLE